MIGSAAQSVIKVFSCFVRKKEREGPDGIQQAWRKERDKKKKWVERRK